MVRLRHNIIAMTLLQVLSYAIPLITLPYLTRVLGTFEWGRIAWVQIISGYFLIIINWGFNLYGTKKISMLRSNITGLSETFINVFAAQCFLCIVCILSFASLVLLVSDLREYDVYLLGVSGLLISNVLFPAWFLTGLERLREVAAIQIVAKLSAIPMIFIFVKGPGDGALSLSITAGSSILGGIISLFWIFRNVGLTPCWPTRALVLNEIRESAGVFGSTVAISLYTSLTPTLLGAMVGPAAVAHYVLADKVRLMIQSGLSPISQSLFPRLSHLFVKDRAAAERLLTLSGGIILLFAGMGSLCIFVFAGPIVDILAGTQFFDSKIVLRILSPLPFIVSLSNIIGVQLMLPNGMTKAFNIILSGAAVLSMAIIIPLIVVWQVVGAATNTLIAETCVTIAMLVYSFKRGLMSPQMNAFEMLGLPRGKQFLSRFW